MRYPFINIYIVTQDGKPKKDFLNLPTPVKYQDMQFESQCKFCCLGPLSWLCDSNVAKKDKALIDLFSSA